jgi:hypothetical protein
MSVQHKNYACNKKRIRPQNITHCLYKYNNLVLELHISYNFGYIDAIDAIIEISIRY